MAKMEQLQRLEIKNNSSLNTLPEWQRAISLNIETLIVVLNPRLDSLPASSSKTNKIGVLQCVSNGSEDKEIILNNWLGFAQIREIYFNTPMDLARKPQYSFTNIHTLPKTFINLAPPENPRPTRHQHPARRGGLLAEGLAGYGYSV
jgi:hypothetical protein